MHFHYTTAINNNFTLCSVPQGLCRPASVFYGGTIVLPASCANLSVIKMTTDHMSNSLVGKGTLVGFSDYTTGYL